MVIIDETVAGVATLEPLGEVVFGIIILIPVTIAGVRSIVDYIGRSVSDDFGLAGSLFD